MEEKKKVVLHGMWASPFVRWVKIALKIKGITYEYVEESMKKKSQLLLIYNPIYKKVPVLVHNEKPIVESLIVLQYIDDTWNTSPYLLPSDAYSKSMIDMPLRKLAASQGIEEEKSMMEVQMNLNILEENMNVIFPYNSPCGENMGLLDILLCCLPNVIKAIEEALNVKIMEPQKYPLTSSRMASLCGLEVALDTAPSHEKLVKFFRAYRRFYTHIN
ncbi:Glutathione S-transferase U9 [Bienertia sinuspersici]